MIAENSELKQMSADGLSANRKSSASERSMNRNRAIAQQAVQPEPRAARFLNSTLVGRGPVNRVVRPQEVLDVR
jgi:hypothetical protein